ncbi:MAG: hypothetical protein NC548_27485 [Lachnospiraceae bacterium]|nr:hypothetical protein [Lachnospiraceae bacterium]
MWLVNYFREWKAWRIVKKVYNNNKKDFDKIGIRSDWFGRLYKVINRDPSIQLGSIKDEELLSVELREISEFLVRQNIMDILAYELTPLEDGDNDSFENAYLITLTPAWDLTRQYVSVKTTFWLGLITCSILTALGYLISLVL